MKMEKFLRREAWKQIFAIVRFMIENFEVVELQKNVMDVFKGLNMAG